MKAGSSILRQAESEWFVTGKVRPESPWRVHGRSARNLRNHLVRALKFAFRNSPEVLSRLGGIPKGDRRADVLQALDDLEAIGREHAPMLAAIGFDLGKLQTAQAILAKIAAAETPAKADETSLSPKEFRDRAYHHLKQAVDEVRRYGKYVFYDDPLRARGYTRRAFPGLGHPRKRRPKSAPATGRKGQGSEPA